MTGLIDISRVVGETRRGTRRYRFLESVREYSKERLREAGEEAEQLARHAESYLQLAEAAFTQFGRAAQATSLNRLENEYQNLRAALA